MTHAEIVETIKNKLCVIEKRENIKIIYACESGSRAWGFASPDSDYDVRFIYVRPFDFYLKLEETKDTLECELNEVYDINGWDLKKFLLHVGKSNPSIFEWIYSPMVYRTTRKWNKIVGIFDRYFSVSKALHHYNSMTKNLLDRDFLGECEVSYKAYLYNLRQCLACEWIMNRHMAPSIEFTELSAAFLPEPLRKTIDELLESKSVMSEKDTRRRIPELDEYIQSIVANTDAFLAMKDGKQKTDWEGLDKVFLKIVYR